MTPNQLAMMQKKYLQPKKTEKKCVKCNEFLTDVNVFFGKNSCGNCEPLYLMHREKNLWDKETINDLPF